jgi:hypothetical protein
VLERLKIVLMTESICDYYQWVSRENDKEDDHEFKIRLDKCETTPCYLCHRKVCYHDLERCCICDRNTCEYCYIHINDHIEFFTCKPCEENDATPVEGSYMSGLVKALSPGQ